MPNVIAWASGYASPYGNDTQEIQSIRAGTWLPSSKDFKAVAIKSGAINFGVKNFTELLNGITKQPAGSINRLGIIAHSNQGAIGLAGTIIITRGGDCTFYLPSVIDPTLLNNRARDAANVVGSFANGVSIVLFSCNAGLSMNMLTGFEAAFGVDCYGFSGEVLYLPKFTSVVTERFWVAYVNITPDQQALIDAGLLDLMSIVGPQQKSSIWALQPDQAFFSRT
jgi:hypothetical protein